MHIAHAKQLILIHACISYQHPISVEQRVIEPSDCDILRHAIKSDTLAVKICSIETDYTGNTEVIR